MAEQPVKGVAKWAALQGQRAQLQRKGFSDSDHGVVSEVNDECVAFVFDGGGVLYVPLDEITDLTEEKEPSPKATTVLADAMPEAKAEEQDERPRRTDPRVETATVPPPGAPRIREKAVDEEGHVTNTSQLRMESEAADRRQQPAKEDVDAEPVRDPAEKKHRLDVPEEQKPFVEWPDTPAHPHQPVAPDKPEHKQQKAVGESIRRPAETQVGEPVDKMFEREEREAKRAAKDSEKAKE